MKVLVLEDEITHQVRMETTLAEIAKEIEEEPFDILDIS